ncbi:SsgA family sporulation/cell division regulator [Frankia sp. AgB32]|uniref:SsgA family sporulation/cell division regulator n=1 Tax=Frankia sp. AgB32 TaxID=631119 RepID=UPI00200F0566|nr:SsgA family sporulation/cell division regulator [Frankia sp. AgB32]MCK9897901.1 SsgA family sporulation/cell division regulator [Frankia sp. AgB32]
MVSQSRTPGRGSFDSSIPAHFLQPDGTRVPFPASLGFDEADPFAVTLRLRTTDIRTVTWTFARQLLIDGSRRPAGVGAVEVRPEVREGKRALVVTMTSAGGRAVVELNYDHVAAFIRDTYDAVPFGSETDHVDWQAELDRLRDGET